MRLNEHQKIILKQQLKKSLEMLGKEPNTRVEDYVEKDFQGIELIMVLMALNEGNKIC